MKSTRKEIIEIVFKYGVNMCMDQTMLVMGNLSPEEAEKTQGNNTSDAVNKILSKLTQILDEIPCEERTIDLTGTARSRSELESNLNKWVNKTEPERHGYNTHCQEVREWRDKKKEELK